MHMRLLIPLARMKESLRDLIGPLAEQRWRFAELWRGIPLSSLVASRARMPSGGSAMASHPSTAAGMAGLQSLVSGRFAQLLSLG
jgi:hypothetical protein